MRHRVLRSIAIVAAAIASVSPAAAEIAVSANDGKQLRPGDAPGTRTPDAIAVLELGAGRPRVLATLAMPACMIGPPEAVAVTRRGHLALVTCSERLDGDMLAPSTAVSLVDLADPRHPRLLQTAAAGPGASGVSVNRAGTLALVASTADDAVTVFAIRRRRLAAVGRIQLEAKARPTDVVFAPDGRSALIVAQGQGLLVPLAIRGTEVTRTGATIAVEIQPYGASFSPDGRFVYNTNLASRAGRALRPQIGSVSATELATGATVNVEVGTTPEHLTLSRDGRYAAVVVANGTGVALRPPGAFGLLQIYRVEGIRLTKVAEAHTGEWGQGAIFSDDGRTILLQIAAAKRIEVYRFDGQALTRDEGATLSFPGRPGSIAAAGSR